MSICSEMAFFPTNFMLHSPPTTTHNQDHHHHHHHHRHHPMLSQDFHGATFLGKKSMTSSMLFSGIDRHEEENNNTNTSMNINGGDLQLVEDYNSDEGSQGVGEKKRRLNMEQVRTLEKSFEIGNKLEPDRKIQLARALGLQPRQIAIWFQNRRARWKTKNLEKDYELLKRQYQSIKAENDALQTHNQNLRAELLALKTREPTESINLNIKENEGCSSNRSENSSEIKLDISRTPPIHRSPPPPNTSIPFFASSTRPSSNNINANVAQLKSIANADQMANVKEENYSNMFCGIDDQAAFWPWLEQQHFN